MRGTINKTSADPVCFAFNHVQGSRNVTFQNKTTDTVNVEVTNQDIQRISPSSATWSTPANGSVSIPVDSVDGIIGPYAFVKISGDGVGQINYAYTNKDSDIIYTPLELFLNGEQGSWYDPSDLSTLFQDSAGTTPVTTDGDPVGLMLDKSGNDNHAVQSVAASRPTYRTDGTLHWLAFDGVDDYFDTGLEHQENWSAYISINLISSGIFFGGRGSSDTRWYLGNAFGVGDYFSTISLNTDNQVISLTTENFEYNIKSNLNSIVSGVYTGTTQPAINSLLFARNNVGNPDLFTGGLFYGCVARNPIEQDTRLIKYLANKAGVTL